MKEVILKSLNSWRTLALAVATLFVFGVMLATPAAPALAQSGNAAAVASNPQTDKEADPESIQWQTVLKQWKTSYQIGEGFMDVVQRLHSGTAIRFNGPSGPSPVLPHVWQKIRQQADGDARP